MAVEIHCQGTSYKKGQFLVTGGTDSIEFGEIVLILAKDDIVHFVVSVHTAEFLSEYHLYTVRRDNENMKCVNISDLTDLYPLTSNMTDGNQVVPLKHSVVDLSGIT